MIKALSLGLADVSVQKSKNGSMARLSFAKDIREAMYEACNYASEQELQMLVQYQRKEKNSVGRISLSVSGSTYREL